MSVPGILTSRRIVLINCKSSKPLIVDVYAPGINTSNHNINAQVKLKAVYQKRVCNVLAYNALLVDWNF